MSRIDLYADFQGWTPLAADYDRFVARSVRNQAYFEPSVSHHVGRRFSGFRFGKDQLVARLYDKGNEIGVSGKQWMREVWGPEFEVQSSVWRLEFQYRREAIADFNLGSVQELLTCRQDLWLYALRWLSLRNPTLDQQRDHWPVAEEWKEFQQVSIGSPLQGVVRRRLRDSKSRSWSGD